MQDVEVTKSLQGLLICSEYTEFILPCPHSSLYALWMQESHMVGWGGGGGMEHEKLDQRVSGKYPSLSPLIDPTSQIEFVGD